MASSYSLNSLLPPSSNPSDIYQQLRLDVSRLDSHSPKITKQRATFIKLARQWHKSGEISKRDEIDIIYMAKNAAIDAWRPLIYIISRDLVDSRLKPVPLKHTAGLGREYIIEDLHKDEFDLIEL